MSALVKRLEALGFRDGDAVPLTVIRRLDADRVRKWISVHEAAGILSRPGVPMSESTLRGRCRAWWRMQQRGEPAPVEVMKRGDGERSGWLLNGYDVWMLRGGEPGTEAPAAPMPKLEPGEDPNDVDRIVEYLLSS